MVIDDENVRELQKQFHGILPILDQNLDLTVRAFYKSEIPNGAYHYVINRHETASLLAVLDVLPEAMVSENFKKPENLFAAGAAVFIDLRTMIKDLSGADKEDAQKKHDDLLALYQKNGFTDTNVVLKIPQLPVQP